MDAVGQMDRSTRFRGGGIQTTGAPHDGRRQSMESEEESA